ncbi:Csu type fimbrial protein [Cellvibrio polysaccharolyticus]|uniref:SCPU domain-containing protein n=1 Tax=Cellvibrio polysaccharolyticus TaxID=2082724 RepID=A0A928V0B7_9GAMM|nr:spore coat U domain-containing protein [Cellvibrio polysaccharolyticus]MBE8716500.1 SCPU domain-containing protein [Cellvibrio polysaccharolyticus]
MNMRKNIFSLLGFSILTAALLPSFASAATVNGILNVQAVVGSGCQVNATNVTNGAINYGTLNFGSIYSLGAQHVDAETTGANQGSITVECSAGTSYNIMLGPGQHFQSATRAMSSGGATLLNYGLFQDPQRQLEWTPNSAIPFTAASTAPTVHHVYGRIPGGQGSVQPGTYTDQVAVVVNW